MASSASISSKIITEVITLGPAPLLKTLGFRKVARHFFRHSPAATCHLDVQASQWNALDRARFTVNLWSYLPAIAVAKGEIPITEPTKQKRAHCGIRIGHLLPAPGDYWWCVNSSEEVPRVAAELTSAIEKYAIPYLDRVATLAGVAELSGHIPAICNDPTEFKAIALRLLGREQEAQAVEAALLAQAEAARQRIQDLIAKRATEA
jgi:hypothetical protein